MRVNERELHMPDVTLGIRLTADSQGFIGEVRIAEQHINRVADGLL